MPINQPVEYPCAYGVYGKERARRGEARRRDDDDTGPMADVAAPPPMADPAAAPRSGFMFAWLTPP
jgi:hypothetical protein